LENVEGIELSSKPLLNYAKLAHTAATHSREMCSPRGLSRPALLSRIGLIFPS